MSKSRSGAPRRVAAGLLAGALTVVGFALAPPAGSVASVTTGRIAGTNRYATAAAVSGQTDFSGAVTAILATGETFPDALAASGLGGANQPSPIILTQSGTYTTEAKNALNALNSLTNVLIVGGTAAVSQSVEDAVKADGFTVTRVAGTDRYGTAAAIGNKIGAAKVGSLGGLKTAIISTGTNFPDSLAGGPVAYGGGFPVLLVTPTSVPAATKSALTDLAVKQVVILGGTAAVSDATETELEGIVGNPAVRVAGTNRFGTAAAVGDFAVTRLGWKPTEVLLANGTKFPDALAGGPLGGEHSAPIILTSSLPAESAAFLDAHSDTITTINALGGTGVIDDATISAAKTSAQNTANDTGSNVTKTSRPELASASIVETRTTTSATATRPPGTYVKYCYDEAITGGPVDATMHFLYYSAGDRFGGTQSVAGPQAFTSGVTAADNKCAEIIFPALNLASLAAPLTLATVDNGAVAGVGGATTDGNIEGDSALTPATSTPAAAGVTAAPDVTSIGTYRDGPTADVTSVDFIFDQAAWSTGNVNGFKLIPQSGAPPVTCTGPGVGNTTASGLAAVGGEGTTTVTVNCPEPASSVQWAAANVARGVVEQGTVGSATGGTNPNPLQAADSGNSGNSSGPDLGSIVFSPDAVVNSDVVSYLLDEAVLAGGGPGGTYPTSSSFAIYTSAGAETFMAAFSCARSSESSLVVSCLMADGALSSANFVGGSMRANAVTEVEAGALPNGQDEVGVSPSAGPTTTAGKTDGADLTEAAIIPVTSPFGNTTYNIKYTFDEDTADTGNTALTATDNAAGGNSSTGENVITQLLHAVTPDGIILNCTGLGLPDPSSVLANRAEDADNTVTCTSFVVSGGAAATATQVHSAVVATVDYGAVDDETAGGDANPEGAQITTGNA